MSNEEMETTRDRYGKVLARLAGMDRNVVALECDLGRSTRSFEVASVDKERFIEMGIAEQDMISTAAGMATMGKVVFANSFAAFITGRAYDQIRQQVALPRLNVKICGSSGGVTIGADGATHQSIDDVALMRSLPNMTVIVPADGNQTEQAVLAAYAIKGPVYIRLSRYATHNYLGPELPFVVGKAQALATGREVVLASCGPILHNVLVASSILQKRGITAGIMNFHTVKPLDRIAVNEMAKNYAHIVSVEEHNIIGGLGSAIAEYLSEAHATGSKAVLLRLGIADSFGESGSADELLRKYGLDPDNIANCVWNLVDQG